MISFKVTCMAVKRIKKEEEEKKIEIQHMMTQSHTVYIVKICTQFRTN